MSRHLLLFGLRFPLQEFVLELLHTIGLSLNHLVPNSYIHLHSFMAFCHDQGVKPTLDFLFQFFTITACKEKEFYQFNKRIGKNVLMRTPLSNKGWHKDWFYIKGPDTELIGPWAEPNKSQLNPIKISRVSLGEFEALYSKRPSTRKDKEVLNDQDWLFSHDCEC